MRSKIITTVIALAIVGPFAYFARNDAVTINNKLHEQIQYRANIDTEIKQTDKQYIETVKVKEKTEQEVEQIATEAEDVISERKKLEAELGAN